MVLVQWWSGVSFLLYQSSGNPFARLPGDKFDSLGETGSLPLYLLISPKSFCCSKVDAIDG